MPRSRKAKAHKTPKYCPDAPTADVHKAAGHTMTGPLELETAVQELENPGSESRDVVWTEVDRTLFSINMIGEQGRCTPCFRWKAGPCMRNPNEPDWPCLSCIDKNRPEKCRFFKPGLLQSIENFHLQSPRTVNPLPAPRPPEIDLFSASESQSHETYQDTLDFHLPTPPALLVLGQYLNQNQLQSLTNFLHNMFATQPLPVTNLQATVISAGENGPPWCPIVRWKEGTNVEAILAIKLQPTEMVNSFVLYHVTDAITEASSRKSLRVSWSVLKVTEFGELHSAGRRYFEQMVEPAIKGPAIDEDVNETEMLNYAMTLMPVLYRLRQMEKNFQQNGLFWIDRLSPRVVLEDDQGNRCTLLQHVVDL